MCSQANGNTIKPDHGKMNLNNLMYLFEKGSGPPKLDTFATPLAGTPGQSYIEKRGIPLEIANSAGITFSENFGGRPAVLACVRNREDKIISVHGRYLTIKKKKPKMLNIGNDGGTFNVFGGWRTDPLIFVEGMFDALSIATCGFAAVATLCRPIPWLHEVSFGRVAYLAFDRGKPGERNARQYKKLLEGVKTIRLEPPLRCKDWSTALKKLGPYSVKQWINRTLT